MVLTQLDGTIWPTTVLSQRFGFPIGGVDSLVGLLCGVAVLGVGVGLGSPGGTVAAQTGAHSTRVSTPAPAPRVAVRPWRP